MIDYVMERVHGGVLTLDDAYKAQKEYCKLYSTDEGVIDCGDCFQNFIKRCPGYSGVTYCCGFLCMNCNRNIDNLAK